MSTASPEIIYAEYSPQRVHLIKSRIVGAESYARPYRFEVKVDEQTITFKTFDSGQFEDYKAYISPVTQKIIFRVWVGNGTRSMVHQFDYAAYQARLKKEETEQKQAELSGVAAKQSEIDKQDSVEKQVNRILKDKEHEELKVENAKFAEAYKQYKALYEELKEKYSDLERQKYTKADISQLAGHFAKGILMANPPVLKKIPMLSGLLGTPPTQSPEQPEQAGAEFEPLDNSNLSQEGQGSDSNPAKMPKPDLEDRIVMAASLLSKKLNNAEHRAFLCALLQRLYQKPDLIRKYSFQINQEFNPKK